MKQFLIRRWPRGKYNGRPIVGYQFSLTVNLWDWRLKPTILLGKRALYADCNLLVHWLCFRVRISPEYSFSLGD